MNYKKMLFEMIPSDWDIVELGRNLELIRNGTTKKQNKKDQGLPVTRIETISDGKIDSVKVGYVDNLSDNEIRKYQMKKRDILFSHINSEPQLGKSAIYNNYPQILIHGMNLLLMRTKKEFLNPCFLNYLFNFYRSKGIFITMASRAVNQSSINQGKMKILKIPLPPLPEQKKISRVLSKIQQAIEQQDKIIEATKNLKKSLIQKLFTEGVINGFMFDTNIFNHILDNKILIENFPENLNLFITHIQLDELEKTRDQNRRKMLLTIFKKIDQENIPTESLVLSVSKLGKAKLGDENGLYKKIKLDLDEKEIKQNNKQDALIAKTTIKNGLILVTDDSDLLEVTQKYNGEVINLEDFLSGNYRKVKETEIEQIPQIWKVVKIENVIDEIISGDWGIDEKENKDGFLKCQVIRGTDFLNLEKRSFSGIPRRLIKESSFKKRELKSGDLLIEISGGSKKQPTGRVFHINNYLLEKSNVPLLFTNFVKLIRVKEETILSEYLWHYWQYLYDKGITRIYEKRTTGIRNFKYKDFLSNEIISIPPFYEQQQIVNIINTVDKKIELEESRKSILKELFKTMLHKLITGEIRLKDINI